MTHYTTNPQDNEVLIYALLDPRNLRIRYIGKTTQPLKRRLLGHVGSARQLMNGYPVVIWIRQLLTLDMKPTIHLLEVTDLENWASRERYWIAYGYKRKWKLLNATNGGDSANGVIQSPETIAKFSTRSRGENNPKAKLTEADVYAIREEYAQGQTSTAAIALRYDVSESNIQMVVRGQTWKHVGGTIVPKGFDPHLILTADDVIEIRRQAASGVSATEIAAIYNVSRSTINQITRGKLWADVGGVLRTIKENSKGENNPTAKLTIDDVRAIRAVYADGNTGYSTLAAKYNVSKTTIAAIISGKTWQNCD
jgi:hypothetical protein